MKKNLTVKELATLASISEGTVRAWIMKPVDGKPYSSENVNYENLKEKLCKYFTNEVEFEKQFGFKIKDIEIVKAQRTTKDWITVDENLKEMKAGTKLTMHNYSLKTELTYLGYTYDLRTVPNKEVLLFVTNDDNYKSYNLEQLSKENVKLEAISKKK